MQKQILKIETRNGSNTVVTITEDEPGFWLYITDDESEQSVWLTAEQMRQIGSVTVPLSEASGSAGRSAAQENSSSSQEQADARPARALEELDNIAAFLRAVEWDNHGTETEAHDHAQVLELIRRDLDALLSGGAK